MPASARGSGKDIHQTRSKRDDDTELQWRREREIAKIEQMWDGEPELPADHPDTLEGDD